MIIYDPKGNLPKLVPAPTANSAERLAHEQTEILSAELAALREDKARLDWIAAQAERSIHKTGEELCRVSVVWLAERDFRAALDAARASEGRRDG